MRRAHPARFLFNQLDQRLADAEPLHIGMHRELAERRHVIA
jgi:hypothetical protein